MGKVQKIKWRSSDRADWLAQRNELLGVGSYDFVRFGSSEVATITGQSRWESPRKLFYNKIGHFITPNHSFKLSMGNLVEPLIANAYEHWAGDRDQFDTDFSNGVKHRRVRQAKYFIINSDHPFQLSSIDYHQPQKYPDLFTGEIVKGGIIMEAKNPSFMNYQTFKGELPDYWMAQVQQQMMVSGIRKAVVAMLVGSDFFDVIEVEEDKEMQKWIDHMTTEFGLNVLKAKTVQKLMDEENSKPNPDQGFIESLWGMIQELEPDVTDSEAEKNFLENTQYNTSIDELVIEGDDDDLHRIQRYLKATRLEGELKNHKTLLRNQLTDKMKEFEVLSVDGYKVTNRRGKEGKKNYFSVRGL